MLFSSMTFIYVFLPVLLFVYYISDKKFHNIILLIASIIFYAWGEPRYLYLLFLMVSVNYTGAVLIDKFPVHKKLSLVLTICCNVGLLMYFKYLTFFVTCFNNIFHANANIPEILLPLGISFYTFQSLSYIIDVYKGECKAQYNLGKLALYICLFPQLIAGPIIKYHDIEDQIDERHTTLDNITTGVSRFIIGLAKKVIIANTMAQISDKVFALDPEYFSTGTSWVGIIAFSLQVYFDFSGYSDMAIGLGLMFGFKFLENFNYPFMSKSVSEFWRRWHISLSSWFKQYVYIPLGGSRRGQLIATRNLFIVSFLTGFWHGADIKYIAWGLFWAVLIFFEKIFKFKDLSQKKSLLIAALLHIYFLIAINVSHVIFRADNLSYTKKFIANMFGFLKTNPDNYPFSPAYYTTNIDITLMIIAIICSTPIFGKIATTQNKFMMILIYIWLLILFLLSTLYIAADTYNPFIYFKF